MKVEVHAVPVSLYSYEVGSHAFMSAVLLTVLHKTYTGNISSGLWFSNCTTS